MQSDVFGKIISGITLGGYVIAPFCVFLGIHGILKTRGSENWFVIEGVITHSEVKTIGSGNHREKVSEIKYKYTVEEQEYSSDRIYFQPVAMEKKHYYSPKLAKKYPKGKIVDVYYDPENPPMSSLKTEVSSSTYKLLAIGIIWVGFPIYFITQSCLNKSKKKKNSNANQ